MKIFIVIFAAVLCGIVASLDSKDTMYIDPLVDVTTIQPTQKGKAEISGDDDDGSGDQGHSSGSGSGDSLPTVPTAAPKTKAKTTERNVVEVRTVKVAPTKFKTESETVTEEPTEKMDKRDEITTSESVVNLSETDKPNTDEDMMGGGIGNGEGKVEASKQDRDGLRVLTKEVIAAVIVGGICAIILIAFLVYRLRKRDEGSYVLTDSAYKDTNKLRGDPGKEAFV